ncbi:CDP-alcohol phosphatidyltransferase family protein [Asanoa sp. NPDC050611]|uniref:CDP-alcohol phosphatidyltransferase family protein n=1 Tax=Asanoa sp. NPDC050611 TaxID=3157098 RepID=UPI0034011572
MILLQHGLSSSGLKRYGPADWVTAARTVLIGVVAALVVDSLEHAPAVGAIVGLVVVALLLDGVDGQVARRTGTTSAFGARFDMEADSFLVLVLSVYVAPAAGWWVLAIGGMRYAFVLGIWSTRWMRGTLPPRYWRKVVAATQGVALVTATAGVLPFRATVVLLLVAFALLVESFGRDVLWLWWDGHPVTRTRVIGRLVPRE